MHSEDETMLIDQICCWLFENEEEEDEEEEEEDDVATNEMDEVEEEDVAEVENVVEGGDEAPGALCKGPLYGNNLDGDADHVEDEEEEEEEEKEEEEEEEEEEVGAGGDNDLVSETEPVNDKAPKEVAVSLGVFSLKTS